MQASRAWKKTSGFWALPRRIGRSGLSARSRWALTSWSGIMARRSSGVSCSILLTSWEVRKPSKKWRNGTRASSVAAWEIRAKSWTSCTVFEQSIAQPVARAAMTSLWSPKIDRQCVASVRAAM